MFHVSLNHSITIIQIGQCLKTLKQRRLFLSQRLENDY